MFVSWSSHNDRTSTMPRLRASPIFIMPPFFLKSLRLSKVVFCASQNSSLRELPVKPSKFITSEFLTSLPSCKYCRRISMRSPVSVPSEVKNWVTTVMGLFVSIVKVGPKKGPVPHSVGVEVTAVLVADSFESAATLAVLLQVMPPAALAVLLGIAAHVLARARALQRAQGLAGVGRVRRRGEVGLPDVHLRAAGAEVANGARLRHVPVL
mmetsp:Transcript_29878/g.67746  ORF Transcript_29878/g.67746 Transcript_29878/m.67746 type:complete len:210 (-) Transcript_29878:691-1320(-)